MPFTQHFFIEGALIASAERQAIRVHEDIVRPPSMIFFCAKCGKVYATAPVVDAGGKESEWHAYRKLCHRHPPTYMFSDIPGSIWLSWDRVFTSALPMPVLKLELERHIQAIERLEENE